MFHWNVGRKTSYLISYKILALDAVKKRTFQRIVLSHFVITFPRDKKYFMLK